MQKALDETTRRRTIQMAYNDKHGITPTTIHKEIREAIRATKVAEEVDKYVSNKKLTKKERDELIASLEVEMSDAARALDFERAAELRDTILELKAEG